MHKALNAKAKKEKKTRREKRDREEAALGDKVSSSCYN
jgi:hypothetical protein